MTVIVTIPALFYFLSLYSVLCFSVILFRTIQRERERETETERERQRQRDRETETETDRQTDRQSKRLSPLCPAGVCTFSN